MAQPYVALYILLANLQSQLVITSITLLGLVDACRRAMMVEHPVTVTPSRACACMRAAV